MFESDKTKQLYAESGVRLAQWNWRNQLSLLSVYYGLEIMFVFTRDIYSACD